MIPVFLEENNNERIKETKFASNEVPSLLRVGLSHISEAWSGKAIWAKTDPRNTRATTAAVDEQKFWRMQT